MLRLLYVVSLLAQHGGCVRVHACRELCDYHNDETRIVPRQAAGRLTNRHH